MLIKKQIYIMNPNYASKVREDLDVLLATRFIYHIETTQWLSPLVICQRKIENCVYVWIIEN
jgi:hypothetical protein